MELSFFMPSRVIFGSGAAQACAERFSALGKRCLIVTGGSSARLCGALDDIMGVLDSAGIIYDIFDKIDTEGKSSIQFSHIIKNFKN